MFIKKIWREGYIMFKFLIVLVSGFMFGDPHIRTLDGAEYAFNGHGEYTLLRIYDSISGEVVFELQGIVFKICIN
jgi:hypothetical protein